MIKLRKEQKSLWQRITFDCWSNWSKVDPEFTLFQIGTYEEYDYRDFHLEIFNFTFDVEIKNKK